MCAPRSLENTPARLDRAMPWLVAVFIVALYTALFVSRLAYITWHDDETVFLLTGRAVAEGRLLYREVWYNYPPGFALYLGAVLRAAGGSLAVGRWAVFTWGLIGLGALYALGATLHSRWGGVAATALLASAPHFVVLSSAVMTEVPAFAAASLGAWAALRYHQRGDWRWLAVSGLWISGAACLKPTSIPVLAAPLTAILLGERSWRERFRRLTILGAAVSLPLGIVIASNQPRAFFAQFLGTYLESQSVFASDLRGNLTAIARYFYADKYGVSHLSLPLLAAFAGWRLWPRQRGAVLILLAWQAATLLQLALHTPLYRHHLLALLFPLMGLAGVGLMLLMHTLTMRPGWLAFPLCLLLAWSAIEARDSAWASVATVTAIEDDHLDLIAQAVDWVRANTPPGSTLLTDGHAIAIWAGRQVPLEAINTSRMRVKTGGLDDQALIEVARRQQPAAIIFWEKKLDSLDDFATWVSCRYTLAQAFDQRRRIYQPQPEVVLPARAVPVGADLGGVFLMGYDVSPAQPHSGVPLTVTLYWQAQAPLEGRYAVFAHLLDREGRRVAQQDGDPVDGRCPTYLWQPGERFEDTHIIAVEGLGAGAPFQLAVGLYDRMTGERLGAGQVLLPLTAGG